ncbi:hypothetical protein ORG37_21285 [Rahnella perminowiae]|uniref:hypothetical protein n=1 Tax=Rahnella perminowiae TaxID=2816244 RepID=UPI00224A97A7|nr:hypothetical protein [Rahnella perminowiae]MCX2945621.1 hypothetical protein [Rahnella perminowiae]
METELIVQADLPGLLKPATDWRYVGYFVPCIPDSPHPSPSVGNLALQRHSLGGSLIGRIAETEILDFCAVKGITSDIEMIQMDETEVAFELMKKSEVKYSFVIDMTSI